MNKVRLHFFYLLSIYPLFAYLFRQIIDVRPNFFIINILAILFVGTLFASKKKKFPTYLKYYLVFVIYTIIFNIANGWLVSDTITGNFNSSAIFEYFVKNKLIATVFVLFLIENTFFSEVFVKRTLKNIWFVVIIATIVIIIQIFIPTFLLSPREYDISLRVFDYNRFSIFSWINTSESGYSFPAFLSILLSSAIFSNKKANIILLFFLGIVYSVASLARYVMLSVFIVLSQYLLKEKYVFLKSIKYVLLLSTIIITLVFALSFANVPINDFVNEEILESKKSSFEQTSAYTRIFAFELFARFFPQKPIFGTGGKMGTDLIKYKASKTSQIHVGWLSLFYYYGLIGGLFYLAFAYHLMKKLYVIGSKTGYWGSFFALLTFFISIMGTGVTFELFYMGFIFAVIYNRYFEQKIEKKSFITNNKILGTNGNIN